MGIITMPLIAWQGFYLKKIKLSTRYKAVYNCAVDENYLVKKTEGAVAQNEQVISHVSMVLTQDVLERKKHKLKLDYILSNYVRKDSTIRGERIDTSSNKGITPFVKNILHFTDKGDFLGPAVEGKGPRFQTRDYKYFYTTAKRLVYNIQDSSKKQITWHSQRSDTVLNTGFKLVFSYPLSWTFEGYTDTMDMHCMRLSFISPAVDYFATNGVMKALGIETYHKGVAAINGSMLIEEKTGRIIRLDEHGSFIGNIEMKTPRENAVWPSVYYYNKHFVLQELIKKPRKKFLGIF